MDFLRALITAPVSITVLFLLSKFIGNKQMSSLNLFDYINGITIGSIAAEMATAEMSDFWACLAALIVYVIIVMLCSTIFRKNHCFLPPLFNGTVRLWSSAPFSHLQD